MSIKLYVDNLSYRYDKYDREPVISGVHIEVESGQFVGIVGPNGSGKSTILKCIYNGLVPQTGEILLEGKNIHEIKSKEKAKKLSVVGQENSVPFNFTVREIVAMGRTPHKKLFEPDTERDNEIVMAAMEQVGISRYAEREYNNLSGGEKQRVLIARALAQDADFVILDEPTNHLDISYQLQILQTLKESGLTVLSAIHDLNLAAMFCDVIYVLDGQTIAAHGTPEEVLTEELIKNVFHVECAVSENPHTGKRNIMFISNIQKSKGV